MLGPSAPSGTTFQGAKLAMSRRVGLIAALLAFVVLGSGPGAAGAEVPGPGLSGHLIITDESQQLFAGWTAEPARRYSAWSVERTARDKALAGVMLFSGCRADAEGNCWASVTYVLYDPRGRIHGRIESAELWRGRAAPERPELAADYMAIVVKPEDPSGTYRMEAEVTDLISGQRLVVGRSFDVQ